MSSTTKTIFVIAAILLVYGYLCRLLNIYFFWDSKSLGWILMAIGFLFYLIDSNRHRRIKGKKTFWIKLGIGLIVFTLGLASVIIFEFKYNSEPYQVTLDYLKADSTLKNEIGEIIGFSLIPTGSQSTTTYNGEQSGNATFFLTVKGAIKYKDVEVWLEKTPETVWTVYSVK